LYDESGQVHNRGTARTVHGAAGQGRGDLRRFQAAAEQRGEDGDPAGDVEHLTAAMERLDRVIRARRAMSETVSDNRRRDVDIAILQCRTLQELMVRGDPHGAAAVVDPVPAIGAATSHPISAARHSQMIRAVCDGCAAYMSVAAADRLAPARGEGRLRTAV
jgi:hypothetical protein